MKKITLISVLFVAFTIGVIAQDVPPGLGVRWGIAVYKPGSAYEGYPGKTVWATIMYKDTSGSVVYTESHTGVLDDFSYLRFTIGEGANPMPPDRIHPNLFEIIVKFCWTATVQTESGPVIVEDMLDVSSVPRSNFAFHAKNAERIGNTSWNDQSLTINEFIDLPKDHQPGFVSWTSPVTDTPVIQPVVNGNFYISDTTVSPITGEQVNVLRLGNGNPRPFIFGPSTPTQLENYYTVCVPSLHKSRHGLGVKVAPLDSTSHSPFVTHNTAAIFADNSENVMSAGVLANAQTWGFYGTAQNGVVGISTGAGSGAGIWGSLGQAPNSGGFKYALYGNSMNFVGGWAAAIFGNGFYTGTWSMSSDARLKSEVRAQSGALDQVMQLRPSRYRYRQDTPYSLPDGIHYGFLAQEMEEVFPDLVSDISMPLSTDPDEMYTSGSTQYKAINYIEMISILTSAMQELNTSLNAKIEAQAKEIAELQKVLQSIDGHK